MGTPVSTFSTPIEIGSMDGASWERFEALVDTGSSYTCSPRDVLVRLGVRPRSRRRFRTADERLIEREVGTALARVDGQEAPTVVVFAEEGGQPL